MPRRVSPALSVLPLLLMALHTPAMSQTPAMAPDIPSAKFEAPVPGADYTKQVVMIPMRDGVKLYTVIVTPKGLATTERAPIMLTRTPYNAAGRASRNVSPVMASMLPEGDDQFVANGYIRVFQDVRGKHGSEGDYVMTRPIRGPLNNTPVDHVTDAWDTIDWLVKNVRQSNGKVGMVGSSYEGFTVLMALADPHPALKAAVPMSAMVDGWRGDDWFHNGAFRSIAMICGCSASIRDATSLASIHFSISSCVERVGGVIRARIVSARSSPKALVIAPRMWRVAPYPMVVRFFALVTKWSSASFTSSTATSATSYIA